MHSLDWRPWHALSLMGLIVVASWVPALRVWPWFWAAPLAAYTLLVMVIPGLRATFRGWRFGQRTIATVAATVVLAFGSCLALIAFHRFARPEMESYRGMLPLAAMGGVVAAGVLFSTLNALFEEIIFRGVMFDAIQSQLGTRMAIAGTAVLFACGHLHGYPPGPVGVLLAGIYGLCLGWLRVFSQGLGLPVLAHMVADATIFTIMAGAGVL